MTNYKLKSTCKKYLYILYHNIYNNSIIVYSIIYYILVYSMIYNIMYTYILYTIMYFYIIWNDCYSIYSYLYIMHHYV